MKKKLNFEEISRKFNSARLDSKETCFDKQFFIAILTGIFKVRIDSVLLRTLKENNIIIVETNKYSFPKDPVYKDKFQRAYEEAVAIRKSYNNKYYKAKASKVSEQPIEISQEESIATAIQILKEAGYRIYKPVTSFEEI